MAAGATGSIGLADSGRATTLTGRTATADRALYRATSSGRNTVRAA